MRFSKHFLLAAAAVLSIGAGAARADESSLPGSPGGAGLDVGVGVICNTDAQAEHYVKLRNSGAEMTPAVNSVNQAEHDPQACGVAAVAFARDKTMATRSQNGKLVSIVRISVLAGYDGSKWARVPAMVQYAVMEDDQGMTI
jgi:hypothetical protein